MHVVCQSLHLSVLYLVYFQMWSVYERGRMRKQGRNQRKISVIDMHSTNGADPFGNDQLTNNQLK